LRILIFGLLFISPLVGKLTTSESEFTKKITSSLLIQDYQGAITTCETARAVFPKSEELTALLIRILSENGQAQKALKVFKDTLQDKELKETFSIVESIAWGILAHDREQTEISKLTSMIGAHSTHDVKAVDLILGAMRSSNALLRSFGLKFSAGYNDRILQKEILRLLKEEKNYFVKTQLIETVGAMRLEEGRPYLKKVIESQSTTHEETALAIQSLVAITDDIKDDDLNLLLSHKRSGVRQLGVALIDHFAKEKQFYRLIPLLKDSSSEVRMHVMATLGTQNIDPKIYAKIEKDIVELTKGTNADLAIMASWLALKFNQEIGRRELRRWILFLEKKSASRAATLAGAGGVATSVMIQEVFEDVSDPFVKANLAIAMIKQKTDVNKAIEYLHRFLIENKENLMWEKRTYPMFTTLVPSQARYVSNMPRYPELVDQITRLNLINMLTIVGDVNTKELIKEFLKGQIWGITSTAAVMLIEEGDLNAFEVVRELLDDEDEKIKLQAALALAFYGKDPCACEILEKAYFKVDWEYKINILEALGFIGSKSSISFLLNVMQEPFGLLRTIAASSTIQCLYH